MAGVVALLLCLVVRVATGQVTVYNPGYLIFDTPTAADWGVTAKYRIEWWSETRTAKLFEFEVLRDTVIDYPVTGPPLSKAIPFAHLPAAPIGRSYTIRMFALDAAGRVSEPSGYTPETLRMSACYNAEAGRNQPVTVRYLGPTSIKVNTYLVLAPGQLAITAPAAVTFVSVEAVGDGQPAIYLTAVDARTTPLVLGPFTRRGTFQLEIRAIDIRGCEGSHPTPLPRLTVTP